MEIALIVSATVVVLSLLVKHEAVMRRQDLAKRYDEELAGLTQSLNILRSQCTSHVAVAADHTDRLAKLERQVNTEGLGKALGRR